MLYLVGVETGSSSLNRDVAKAMVKKTKRRSAVRRVGPTVMDLLQNHPWVERVEDERALGNGVIVTLKQGWSFEPMLDNRVRGEDTPSAILKSVRQDAQPFAGPYDA